MTPYYEDDSVTLFHGDSLVETDWTAADVLVTDPPYGVAYESSMNRDRRSTKKGQPVAGDASTDARGSALALWGDGPAIVFGRWDVARPDGTRARLIWDKGNTVGMGDLAMPWGRSEEEIYVLGTGFSGKRSGNVLRVQMLMSGDKSRPNHPTPKPIPLMEQLIAKCPDGLIADPFAGSGATLIAARNLGRRAVGVELEERYCEIIANRLSQSVLFEGV